MVLRYNYIVSSTESSQSQNGTKSTQSQSLKIQQQQQYHLQQQQQKIQKSESKNNKNLSRLYQSGKQRIMISFYNLYRNYPTEPPSFSLSKIWLMGKCFNSQLTNSSSNRNTGNMFHNLLNTSNNNNNNNNNNNSVNNVQNIQQQEIQRFLKEFSEILWFSYRKDFPPISNTSITTDIGWGCMVRTGQMLLAQALLRHFYSNPDSIPEKDKLSPNSIYRNILTWFCDLPSKECIYSIHQIVHNNKILEKKQQHHHQQQQQQEYYNINPNNNNNNNNSGDFMEIDDNIDSDDIDEWFSPTKISNVLRQLVKNHNLENLTMYVPVDGVIYTDYVKSLCTMNGCASQSTSVPCSTPPSGDSLMAQKSTPLTPWKSLIVMIPLRLGIDKVSDIYIQRIKALFELPQSIGIIGGKPKQSFYFVGYQDDQIIYLDPHFVHESASNPTLPNFTDTYRRCVPQKMQFSSLDPSLAVGFYCHDREDFESLCHSIKEMETKGLPIISIGDIAPAYYYQNPLDDSIPIPSHNNSNSHIRSSSSSSDDYAFDDHNIPNYSKPPQVKPSLNSSFNNNHHDVNGFDDNDDDDDDFTMIN